MAKNKLVCRAAENEGMLLSNRISAAVSQIAVDILIAFSAGGYVFKAEMLRMCRL